MKLTPKEYKIVKTKNYFKRSNLFVILNGTNKESNSWIAEEQHLKKINFDYYRIFNKTSKKTLSKSVYSHVATIVNSVIFLIKPRFNREELVKQRLINNLKSPTFVFLAIKLNNKIYSKTQIEDLHSFNYKENKLLFSQLCVVNSKILYKNKVNYRNNVI